MKKLIFIVSLFLAATASAATNQYFVPRATGQGSIGLSTAIWGGVWTSAINGQPPVMSTAAINSHLTALDANISTAARINAVNVFTGLGVGSPATPAALFHTSSGTYIADGDPAGNLYYEIRASGLATGITTGFDTTTAAKFTLTSAGSGGLVIQGLRNDAADMGLMLKGISGTTGAVANPVWVARAAKRTGTTTTALTGTDRAFEFSNNDGTAFLDIIANGNITMGVANKISTFTASSGDLAVTSITAGAINNSGNLIMSGGYIRSYARTMAQLLAITPGAVGSQYFCSDCSPAKMVVSTGTAAGNFSDMMGGTFQ